MPLANYCIYKFTSPSGKSYVGQTKEYKVRCRAHQAPGSKCSAISSAIKKYGWDNFTRTILKDKLTLEEANHLEVFYIKYFDTIGKNGYNLMSGGANSSPGKETRDKISAANTGKKHPPEFGAKITARQLGKPMSLEARANMSQAAKGKIISVETRIKLSQAGKLRINCEKRKPVFGYSPTGELLKTWNSITECATDLKANRCDVRRTINGVQRLCKSFVLRHGEFGVLRKSLRGLMSTRDVLGRYGIPADRIHFQLRSI